MVQGLEAAQVIARIVVAVVSGQVYTHVRKGYMSRVPCTVWMLVKALRQRRHVLQRDVVFVVSTMDEPQVSRADMLVQTPSATFPVFSFSRTSNYADVLVPDFAFCHWRDTGNPLYWAQYYRRPQRREHARRPLSSRTPVAILRSGMNSHVLPAGPRQLVTNYVASLREEKKSRFQMEYQAVADPLEHCGFKYLMVVEGYAWTARTKWWMLCGSVTLYGEGEYEEWIRPALVPWLHYVPLPWHGNGVDVSVEWLEENADAAQQVATAGTAFAEAMFDEPVVLDYLASAIDAVAGMQAHLPLQRWLQDGYSRAGMEHWHGWTNLTRAVLWDVDDGNATDPIESLVALDDAAWQYTSEPPIPVDQLAAIAAELG